MINLVLLFQSIFEQQGLRTLKVDMRGKWFDLELANKQGLRKHPKLALGNTGQLLQKAPE